MHLQKLQLEGYKRFTLGGIRYLTWSPESPYQMILGSNGSGKSSLMSECSPLPAVASDYEKGGKKTIYYEHEGHQYILTSILGTRAEHQFVRDGVSMNTGGTAAIQKVLVSQYFNGYNEEMHAILTGKLGFTAMSVADRRRLLTEMSQEDYRYALGLYDRLKVAGRDLQGHLKHLKQRIHDETVALKEGPALETLNPQVAALQQALTDLLYARFPSAERTAIWQKRCEEGRRAILSASEDLVAKGKVVSLHLPERSATGLGERLRAIDLAIQGLDEALTRSRVDYSDTEAVAQALTSAQVEDMAALTERLVQQRSEVAKLEAGMLSFPGLKDAADPAALLKVTQEILAALMQTFAALPDNSERWVCRETLATATAERKRLREAIEAAEHQEADLKGKIHAIEHADRITCPACQHQWILGLDPKALATYRQDLVACQAVAAKLKEALAAVDQSLERMDGYLVLYRQWKGYVHQYPGLHLLWDTITNQGWDTNHPEEHRDLFLAWHAELDLACQRAELQRRIGEEEALLATTPQGERKLLMARLTKLAAAIEDSTQRKRALQAERKEIASQQAAYQAWEAAEARYQAALAAWTHAYEEGLAALATEVMDQDIAAIQTQLGALQHGLQTQTQRHDRLASLLEDQAKAEKDLEALQLLARELSPKEGEIAERMHAFMQGWVKALNFTLRQVWSYELEVLPCNFESGDLNYRFPVYLGGNDQTSPDVTDTSTSIGQILNFAFRQAYVHYKNLKDLPLFVDELDANFDDTHRVKLFPYLARLMDGEHYAQLFMISHYQNGWDVFPEAEYVVIDDRNLINRPPANPHLVIG